MKYEKVVNRYNDALKENILKCNTCEYSKTFEKKEQAYEQERIDDKKISDLLKQLINENYEKNSLCDTILNKRFYNVLDNYSNVFNITIGNKMYSISVDENGMIDMQQLLKFKNIIGILPFDLHFMELYKLLVVYSLNNKTDIEELTILIKLNKLKLKLKDVLGIKLEDKEQEKKSKQKIMV